MALGRDYAPVEELKRGSRGLEVQKLYDYLKRFGYFPNESLTKFAAWRPAMAFDQEDPDSFDETMEQAVRLFQRQQGLKPDGWVGPKTLALLRRPRCGNPDVVPTAAATDPSEGVTTSDSYERWPLSYAAYSINSYTSDLPRDRCREAVLGALRRWAAVTSIAFTERSWPNEVAIGWFIGEHIFLHEWFESAGYGILGHAYPERYNGGPRIVGAFCFNDLESWSTNTPPSGTDVATLALHLLGHVLGLEHSDVTSSVMYAYYSGPRRELTPDDVRAIQALYGPRFRWAHLGKRFGKSLGPPAVSTSGDGRIEVFAWGEGQAIWHIAQTTPSNGWGSWSQVAASKNLTHELAVGRNADGRMEVFSRGTSGVLWHIHQVAPNNSWSSPESLGGEIEGRPAVGRNADGRLEVFARGSDGALWHQWQLSAGGTWSRWASLGGVVSDLTVVSAKDGRLEIFARNNASAVAVIAQTAPNNGWGRWKPLGGAVEGSPAVVLNADGRIEVFARGTDRALWHAWQNSVNGSWSGWASLGGDISWDPAVIGNRDGRLEVFARDSHGALGHIWQTTPGNWSRWATLGGGLLGTPCPARNADGRLECVILSWDSDLWTTWQTVPGNGWDAIRPS